MARTALLRGCLRTIMDGNEPHIPVKPVVQLLGHDRVHDLNGPVGCIRISDGRYHFSYAVMLGEAMLRYENGEFPCLSVVVLDEYGPTDLVINGVQTNVLGIIRMTLQASGRLIDRIIDDPTPLDIERVTATDFRVTFRLLDQIIARYGAERHDQDILAAKAIPGVSSVTINPLQVDATVSAQDCVITGTSETAVEAARQRVDLVHNLKAIDRPFYRHLTVDHPELLEDIRSSYSVVMELEKSTKKSGCFTRPEFARLRVIGLTADKERAMRYLEREELALQRSGAAAGGHPHVTATAPNTPMHQNTLEFPYGYFKGFFENDSDLLNQVREECRGVCLAPVSRKEDEDLMHFNLFGTDRDISAAVDRIIGHYTRLDRQRLQVKPVEVIVMAVRLTAADIQRIGPAQHSRNIASVKQLSGITSITTAVILDGDALEDGASVHMHMIQGVRVDSLRAAEEFLAFWKPGAVLPAKLLVSDTSAPSGPVAAEHQSGADEDHQQPASTSIAADSRDSEVTSGTSSIVQPTPVAPKKSVTSAAEPAPVPLVTELVSIPSTLVRSFTRNDMQLFKQIQTTSGTKVVDPGVRDAAGKVYRITGPAENVRTAMGLVAADIARLQNPAEPAVGSSPSAGVPGKKSPGKPGSQASLAGINEPPNKDPQPLATQGERD